MTTKSDLIARVATSLGVTQASVKAVVDALINSIGLDLAGGQKVQIAGLGTFEKKATAARVGRNPRTGEPVSIPAGSKLAFKASSELKAAAEEILF